MMKKDEKIRQQISALADGELDPSQLKSLLIELRQPEARADWDIYHRIGDVLRSETMAREPSADFTQRLAARLEQEPSLLAPRRLPAGRLNKWSAALTAVAAASFGFLLSPSLFHSFSDSGAPASLASAEHLPHSESQANRNALPSAPSALLADASDATAHAETADYIRLHQNANPSLYSAPALVQPAALNGSVEK